MLAIRYQERRYRPVRWWEIAALEPEAELFGPLLSECLGEWVYVCGSESVELKMRENYKPIEDWQIVAAYDIAVEESTWGSDGWAIAEWFDSGDLMWFEPDYMTSDQGLRSWFLRLRRLPAQVGAYLGLL